MIEIHQDALASSNVPYNDFLLFYQMGKKMVYGFIEGKTDPSFYRTFLENVLPDRWECKLIQAGNKDKVLALYAAFDWSRFPRKAVCFFVDRDLSEFLGGEKYQGNNLFVSDNYSIENELMTEHTFERTLDEVCAVGSLQPAEMQKLKELFQINLALFKEALACVMAQIILWRRAQKNGNNFIARLDSVKVKTLFEFNSGVIALKPAFTSATSRVQYAADAVEAPISSEAELQAAETEFRDKAGIEKFVRGKYLISFFLECTESLRLAIPILFKRHAQTPGKTAGVGEGNAMMIIGPRVRCPATLLSFLERNYADHIKQTGNVVT